MGRNESDHELIGGKHAVLEALRAGRPVHKIWVADKLGKQADPVLAEARKAGIAVQQADRRKLDKMLPADVRHQGVVAQVAAYRYAELEDLLEAAERSGEPPFLVMLDEIEDPHNLGSILRSAECAGVHGVIVPKRRSAGLTQVVAKTSAGAVEHVPVARVGNLAQTMEILKERGIWFVGADASAETEVYGQDLTLPIAWVIGNEGHGLGRLIREKCDFLVKLPLRGQINSLNASVAAGVLMYETVRQRGERSLR